ncbi:ketohexokinase-like isoform X3 [Daphnia pulicaria]|uniref:ketohexokinase-like isoform X3 n=1 Tax=Daphnia pulicaria TaxID=35523 RepID=UPI001EEA9F52|nr:ketohexokinase-like isoform X3 [Daphnia pulicaria]
MANASLCVGLVCIDIVAESERFPVEDTDHRIPNLSYRRGGNASNSCSVLSQLGMKTEFLGTLSNSIQLDFIQRDFAEHSVSIEHCPIFPECEFPTSIVILNACNSTRTIMHHPTHLQELGVQHFTNLNLNNYSWIHFEGRIANVDNIKQMIKFVRENSKSIKISVEIEKTRTVLGELLPLGDVVFISKEFSQFSGFPTMKEAVKGFIGLSRPGCIVVCAWGSEGAAAGQNVDGTDVVKCQGASAPCHIIDTLGAGDTFNAAFIYGQINLWDWKKGLEFACHIAGCKIGLKGFLGLGQFKQTFLFEASDNDSPC